MPPALTMRALSAMSAQWGVSDYPSLVQTPGISTAEDLSLEISMVASVQGHRNALQPVLDLDMHFIAPFSLDRKKYIVSLHAALD